MPENVTEKNWVKEDSTFNPILAEENFKENEVVNEDLKSQLVEKIKSFESAI